LDLIEKISSFEYSLWIVCFALYLFDHLKLLSGDELLYETTPFDNWHLRLSKVPFSIHGKDLYLINPFFPAGVAFKARWGADTFRLKKKVRRERRSLLIFMHHLRDVRVASMISFITFTIMGPYFTSTRGLLFALLTVVSVNLVLNLALLPMLWLHHDTFRLSKGKIVALCVESLIVFPYVAALAKRISFNYEIRCDGLMLAKTLGPNSNYRAILDNATERLKERLESLSDSPDNRARAELHKYISSVQAF